jgi:hypothetical protein
LIVKGQPCEEGANVFAQQKKTDIKSVKIAESQQCGEGRMSLPNKKTDIKSVKIVQLN